MDSIVRQALAPEHWNRDLPRGRLAVEALANLLEPVTQHLLSHRLQSGPAALGLLKPVRKVVGQVEVLAHFEDASGSARPLRSTRRRLRADGGYDRTRCRPRGLLVSSTHLSDPLCSCSSSLFAGGPHEASLEP